MLNTTICDSEQHAGYLQWNLTANADTAQISFDGGAHVAPTWGTPTGGVFKYISPYLLPLDPNAPLTRS